MNKEHSISNSASPSDFNSSFIQFNNYFNHTVNLHKFSFLYINKRLFYNRSDVLKKLTKYETSMNLLKSIDGNTVFHGKLSTL